MEAEIAEGPSQIVPGVGGTRIDLQRFAHGLRTVEMIAQSRGAHTELEESLVIAGLQTGRELAVRVRQRGLILGRDVQRLAYEMIQLAGRSARGVRLHQQLSRERTGGTELHRSLQMRNRLRCPALFHQPARVIEI